MGKVIYRGYAKKNDPIYTGRYIISNPKVNLNKIRKGDNKWRNYLFSLFLEIKQGKKLLKW